MCVVCDSGYVHVWRSEDNLRYWSLPSLFFETGFLLFSNVCDRLVGLWTSADSSCHITAEVLGFQLCTREPVYLGLGDSKSGPHA